MDINILYLILLLILLSVIINKNLELFSSIYPSSNSKSKNAICFITRKFDLKLLEFAELCSKYNDTYLLVDDNEEIIQHPGSNVKIIQMDNNKCTNSNYIKSTWRFSLNITGWDKAFYYFCEDNNYDNVWFIEDDVFISKPNILYELDNKYGSSDLLIRDIVHVTNPTSNNKAWIEIVNDLNKFPDMNKIYWSWVCAMRCSKKLLELMKTFKNKNNQLYFHELLIPSLVINNNLSYKKIEELKYIIYRSEYKDVDIISKPTYLFHPMKDYNRHKKLRSMINNF
jgi:hypothetical protein